MAAVAKGKRAHGQMPPMMPSPRNPPAVAAGLRSLPGCERSGPTSSSSAQP